MDKSGVLRKMKSYSCILFGEYFQWIIFLALAAVALFYSNENKDISIISNYWTDYYNFDLSHTQRKFSEESITPPKYLVSNAGTHVYPYMAAFATFTCLLVTFILICQYGPKLGR